MTVGSYARRPKDLDEPDATFTRPDMTTITGWGDLGSGVTGHLLEPDRRSWPVGS